MKIRKLVSLALAIAVISVLFTGCKALDRAKENHAYYTDKTKTEIIYKGKTYKALPECEDLHPEGDTEEYHTLSEKDIPILISVIGSSETIYSACNDEILTGNYYTSGNYARSDVYEKYAELIKNYKLDRYVYWHSEYNNKLGSYYSELRFVDADDMETIKKAELSGVQEELPESVLYNGDTLEMMLSDETKLFTRDSLIIYTEDSLVYLTFLDRGVSYKVSEEYAPKIKEIVKKYYSENVYYY